MKLLYVLIILLAGCSQNVYAPAIAEAQTIYNNNGGLRVITLEPMILATKIKAQCKDYTILNKTIRDTEGEKAE